MGGGNGALAGGGRTGLLGGGGGGSSESVNPGASANERFSNGLWMALSILEHASLKPDVPESEEIRKLARQLSQQIEAGEFECLSDKVPPSVASGAGGLGGGGGAGGAMDQPKSPRQEALNTLARIMKPKKQ